MCSFSFTYAQIHTLPKSRCGLSCLQEATASFKRILLAFKNNNELFDSFTVYSTDALFASVLRSWLLATLATQHCHRLAPKTLTFFQI